MRRIDGGHGYFVVFKKRQNGWCALVRERTFFILGGISMQELIRYSVITQKNPREIVLLRGRGCAWKRCTFCDYHLDSSPDLHANFICNQAVLRQVTGQFGRLEVINSGSFCDLDNETMHEIIHVCQTHHIHTLHFECHWMHRQQIPSLRARLAALGIQTKIKIGVETFDRDYREHVLCKGIGISDPAQIAAQFDECCLLFGLSGQTETSIRYDIETALTYFDRVCINIMVPNSTPICPDDTVIRIFEQQIAPDYLNNPRVDILMENTDFGVGGALDE